MHMHIKEGGKPLLSEIKPKSSRFCLNANLRKATRVIGSLYSEAMHDSSLKGTQYTMLSAISGFGKASINQLSEFLVMDQTTITRAVKLLEKAGHIEVQKGEDQRQRLVHLTETGQDVLAKSYPMWLEAQNKVWDHLGDEKAKQLLELSQKIVDLWDDN